MLTAAAHVVVAMARYLYSARTQQYQRVRAARANLRKSDTSGERAFDGADAHAARQRLHEVESVRHPTRQQLLQLLQWFQVGALASTGQDALVHHGACRLGRGHVRV